MSEALQGRRVLVAEDDDLIAELIEYKLRLDGCQVTVVADGGDAWDRVREDKPDLIILDGMLPGLDGLEVLRRVRADSVVKETPVVMLTARRLEQDIVGALKLGASDYLVKPFMPEELIARVERLLLQRSFQG